MAKNQKSYTPEFNNMSQDIYNQHIPNYLTVRLFVEYPLTKRRIFLFCKGG